MADKAMVCLAEAAVVVVALMEAMTIWDITEVTDSMARVMIISFLALFIIWVSVVLLQLDGVPAFNRSYDSVNKDMVFKVRYIIEEMDGSPGHLPLSDASYVLIQNARVILIDDKTGEIIGTGLTDESGIWKTNITVSRDLRFKKKYMGTITVITIANGYNEAIHFNVPVNEYPEFESGDFIVMQPIHPDRRNEPSFENAEFHRFTVFEMLNCYADKLGLKRQPVIQNGEVPPWSPDF